MYVSKAWHTLVLKCLLGSLRYTALPLTCKALQKYLMEEGKIQMLIVGMVLICIGRGMTHLLWKIIWMHSAHTGFISVRLRVFLGIWRAWHSCHLWQCAPLIKICIHTLMKHHSCRLIRGLFCRGKLFWGGSVAWPHWDLVVAVARLPFYLRKNTKTIGILPDFGNL